MDGEERSGNSSIAAIMQAAKEIEGLSGYDMAQGKHSTTITGRAEDNPKGQAEQIMADDDTVEIQFPVAGEQALHIKEPCNGMKNTETQSLTWGELTLEMLSDIVRQQVISVSPMEGFSHGHGPPCFHMSGIKWKDLIDMIICTHNAMCQQTGVLFSPNTVQVGVSLESRGLAPGMMPIYTGSKKVDAGTQTHPDHVSIDKHILKKETKAKVEMADVESHTVTFSDEGSSKNIRENDNQERIRDERSEADEEHWPNQGSIAIRSASNLEDNESPNREERTIAHQGRTIDGDRPTDINKMTAIAADEASSDISNNPSESLVKEADLEVDAPVKGLPAQCPVCKKRFRSRYMLKRHSVVHEENHNRHPCIFCEKVCKTQCYLERHMATHFKPEKQFKRKKKVNQTLSQGQETAEQTQSQGQKPAEQTQSQEQKTAEQMQSQEQKTAEQTPSQGQNTAEQIPSQVQKPAVQKSSQCPICFKTFSRPRNLKRHEKVHLKSDCHPCPYCDKVCKSQHYLQLHMMVHADEKQHKCPECGVSFGAKYKLKQHRSKEHNVFEQHVCNVCGVVYKHKETLEDHMLVHTSKTAYLCELCGKTFNRPSVYRLHLAYHTSRASPETHSCPDCPKSYATKSLLTQHIRSAHLKERNHKCSVCGRGFFNNQNRLKHEQVHSGTRPHLCTFCGKRFAQKQTFIAHRRKHLGYRPFVCQICNKAFTSKPHLAIHAKSHTSTEQPKPRFQCKVCSKTFTNKTAWSVHEKRHTGIKDYKCEFCSGAFVSNGDLIRHLKKHTGGRPFKCQQCDMRFPKKLELTEHEVSHAVVEVPITVRLLPIKD